MKQAGFTLLELLIVIGILMILSALSVIFVGSLTRNRALSEETKKLQDYLKLAQIKSLNQESAANWGVHLENQGSGNSWYGIFQGPTYNGTTTDKIYISDKTNFSLPPQSSSTNIIFSAFTGRPTQDTTITLFIIGSPQNSSSVFIKTTGLIYGQ